ncbi:MAG TPA: response regulator [Candidatus Latescibacteria bacterium]|nr:response regulator [Candidatus Handelsmanbacteria bacterium]HIL10617.1 response regulator [Candidatus Latescibacterota bacterium]
MVIEDEEEVRMVLERALGRCGYKTLMAENGPMA